MASIETWWKKRTHPARARHLARGVALSVFVAGLILSWPPWQMTAGPHRTEILRESFEIDSKLVASSAACCTPDKRLREVTVKDDDSGIDDLIENEGVIAMVRLLILGAGAFLAGAMSQRVYLGNYAFKAGPLEFGRIDESQVARPMTLVLQGLATAEQERTHGNER